MSVQCISAAFAYEAPSPTCKLVLLALANYADENRQCFPPVKRIAKETGLSERAVRNAIKSLMDCGAIEKQERRRANGTQTSDLFTLTLQAASNAVCASDRLHDVPQQTAPRAPLTTLEPSLEPSPKTRAAIAEQIWMLQPQVGGKRKAARPDVRDALEAVVKRGGRPEDVLTALTVYYRLPDCRKDEGRFASGAVVMMNKDRWRDFLPSAAPAVNPNRPVDAAVVARRLRQYRDTGTWEATWGQRPDPAANDREHSEAVA